MSQAIQTAPPGHYRLKHVVKSEVAKILTLPSTAITLGLTVVAGLLVTGLVTNAALHHGPDFYNGFDPTQHALTGLIVAGLTGGVFGALLITAEYSSGTIRADPGRHAQTAPPAGRQDRRGRRGHGGLLRAAELRVVLPRPGHPVRRAGRPRRAWGRPEPSGRCS